MRLFVLITVTCIIVVSCTAVAALAGPVGNIAKPAMLKNAVIKNDSFGIIIEELYENAFDKKTDDDGLKGDSKFWFFGSQFGVALLKKVYIYGMSGITQYKENFTDEGIGVKMESKMDYGWGVGGTVILYEKELKGFNNSILRIGADGKYRHSDFDINEVTIDGTTYGLPNPLISTINLEVKDWQVAGEASLQYKRFIPYFGVKYTGFKADMSVTAFGTLYDDDTVKPTRQVGIFVGTDFLAFDSVAINLEGRFIDEEAISASCAVKF